MNVHVAVPDLFWPDAASAHETRADRLPALEALVAKGRRAAGRSSGLEAWLLERWGVADAGAAPYALFADGGDPGEAWWLCAEPCHPRVNLDHLVPTDATLFDVAYAEAEGLVESLNRHFAAVGLAFYLMAALRTELARRRLGRGGPDLRDLLDLVALGTVADQVPLQCENRILAATGLQPPSLEVERGGTPTLNLKLNIMQSLVEFKKAHGITELKFLQGKGRPYATFTSKTGKPQDIIISEKCDKAQPMFVTYMEEKDLYVVCNSSVKEVFTL